VCTTHNKPYQKEFKAEEVNCHGKSGMPLPWSDYADKRMVVWKTPNEFLIC